jgi:hypothetical protein
VLARDGYRCMITGLFDEESYKRCAELRTIARRDNVYKVVVQTSQILKESTMQGIDPAGTDEEGPMVNKVRFCPRCKVLRHSPLSRHIMPLVLL